jgi:AraC-like DNA-binding protein
METAFLSQHHLECTAGAGEHRVSRADDRWVRQEWLYSLVTASQRLAGATLEADKARFLRAFDGFAEGLPEPASGVEQFVLRQCALSCAIRAGHQFHRAFHARVQPGDCVASPFERLPFIWRDSGAPRMDVMVWAADFVDAFEADHEWPAAIRAASILQRRITAPLRVATLAREVGCSASTLTKSFSDGFDVTMSEYLSRLRLRRAIAELREPDSKVAAIAREVGYSSTKNFYRALKQATGLTPTAIRALSEAQLQELTASALAEPSFCRGHSVG